MLYTDNEEQWRGRQLFLKGRDQQSQTSRPGWLVQRGLGG
jgi:hypothetical protein